jgi:hypothetical protein
MPMIAVATMTWVRTALEEARLRRSLERLAGAGLPVAVADADTSPAFSRFLETLPGCRVAAPRDGGLVGQVKASIELAATFGASQVLYTEPDKEAFFGPLLDSFTRRASEVGGGGVVLAARSDESLQTFPPMQRFTEGVINHLCAVHIGVVGDYSYGPFIMDRALLPHVSALDGGLGWGWRPSTFLAAHRLGLRVVHLADDYPCPAEDLDEDERERAHRMRQLSQNILGLVDARPAQPERGESRLG